MDNPPLNFSDRIIIDSKEKSDIIVKHLQKNSAPNKHKNLVDYQAKLNNAINNPSYQDYSSPIKYSELTAA